MILAIIFLVLFAVCTGLSIFFTVSLVKTPVVGINYKRELLKPGLAVIGATISFLVASFGFYMWLGAKPDAAHVVQLVIGAILFVCPLLVAINCFILHYYGKNIPEALDKWLFRIQLVGFVVATVFFFIWTNGLAPYLTYPLVNGISFTEGLVTPEKGHPNIAFYAICILSGAILVYFVCDHYMYKEYGEHGILESTFFVAFPAGIIGARIAYVIGNWAKEFDYGRAMTTMSLFGNDVKVWAPLAIWEGGITILGGAVGGIVVGVLWYLWRNKGKSIWVVFDIVLPTILIAQAIGRWGNFFNCEVHGLASNVDNWKWLPEIVWRNGQYSSTSPDLRLTDQMYVPLFFIEAVVNLFGYFVLGHVFGKALRKYTELGDVGFGYIIWYGLTRVFMEPLRDSSFQMGEKGYWSWIWSLIFVAVGSLLIAANHIVRHIIRKKQDKYVVKKNDLRNSLIGLAGVVVASAALIVVGAVLMTSNPFVAVVAYNSFNVGTMLLVIGASLFAAGLAVTLPTMFEAIKENGRKHA